MTEEKTVERIWVGIRQAAEITGYRVDALRPFAISACELPPEERSIKVRFRSKRYEFWLPDLLAYIANTADPFPVPKVEVEPIWVTTTEAAEATDYNFQYIQRLAYKIWQQPEADRLIKLRVRSGRYELWLPDLIYYVRNIGYGPESKKAPPNS